MFGEGVECGGGIAGGGEGGRLERDAITNGFQQLKNKRLRKY